MTGNYAFNDCTNLYTLLPGFGCWSQDQTTARLGKTNEGEVSGLLHCNLLDLPTAFHFFISLKEIRYFVQSKRI